MNWKTSVVLVVIAVAGAAGWWWVESRKPKEPPSQTRDFLENVLREDKLTSIEIQRGTTKAILQRQPGGAWALPGGWPVRDAEVQQFVRTLVQLRSRFTPTPLPAGDPAALRLYGLDKDPLRVLLTIDQKQYALTFGEVPEENNRFIHVTYLRVADYPEIVRLGPGLVAALDRPREYFQKPRLFAAERVAKDKKASAKVDQLDATSVTVKTPEITYTLIRKKAPDKDYTLNRAADDWELAKPFRDRVEPDRLEKWLTGFADIWAERFLGDQDVAAALYAGVTAQMPTFTPALLPQLHEDFVQPAEMFTGIFDPAPYRPYLAGSTVGLAAALTPAFPGNLAAHALDRAALAHRTESSPTHLVVQRGKDTVTLIVGGKSPRGSEYRFARVQGNPQLFEIKADNLRNIAVAPRSLRDTQLARFKADDARRLEIALAGGSPSLVFVNEEVKDADAKDKKDGKKEDKKDPSDPDAKEKKTYRWRMKEPEKREVEVDQVKKLLNELAGANVPENDIIYPEADQPDRKKEFGLDAPVVVVIEAEDAERKTEDKKAAATKRFTFRLGFKPEDKKDKEKDKDKEKVKDKEKEKAKTYVQVNDLERVSVLAGEVGKLAGRSAVAYRSRKLLDLAAGDVTRIEVKRTGEKGETFTLAQSDKGTWRMVQPAAEADPDTALFARKLGKLEASEFITEKPGPKELEEFGLANPKVALHFEVSTPDKKDAKKKTKERRTLLLGSERVDENDYYARLDDGPVFTVPRETFAMASRDSLAYRALDLWTLAAADISEVKVKNEKADFVLKRDTSGKAERWRLSGSFEAPVADFHGGAAANLARLRRQRFVTLKADKLADYGLDNPPLTVSLLPKDNKKTSITLKIGKSDNGKGRFAQLEGDPAVFTVAEGPITPWLTATPLDLLERELIKLDSKTITEIRTAGPSSFTLRRDKDEWQIAGAPVAFAPDEAAVKDALVEWSHVIVGKFIDYGPKVEWEKYDLAKPSVSIAVKAGDKEYILAFGKEVPDQKGAHYIRLDLGKGSEVVKGMGLAILDAYSVRSLKRPYLAFVDHDLLKQDPNAVTAISRLKGKTEDLRIVKVDDAWNLEKPGKHSADGPHILSRDERQGLLARTKHLRAERIEAYPHKPADLKRFGLDEPEYTLLLHVGEDQKPHRIQIGGVADKETGSRYAIVSPEEKPDTRIAVLPGQVVRELAANPLYFRDHNLARFSATDRLEYQRGEHKAVFKKIDDRWQMVEPVKGNAEGADLEAFLSGLFLLRADEIVAEKPADKKPFGLSPPRIRARFFLGDKKEPELDLAIGKMQEGRVYAELAGSDLVFLLSPKLSPLAQKEFRDRMVWPPLDVNQVERVTFTPAEKAQSFSLVKLGETWQDVGAGDVKINAKTVIDTLDALARLQALHYVAEAKTNLQSYGLAPTAVLSIQVQTKEGGRTLHIGHQEGEGNTGRYYARVDAEGAPVFVIPENLARRIVRNLQAFKE